VEAAELYRQQKDDADISSALSRFGEAIIAGAGAPDLSDRLCRASAEVLECDFCNVYLVEEAEQAILPTAAFGLSQEEWETLRVIRYPLAIIGPLSEALERDSLADIATEESPTLLPAPVAQQAANAGITRMIFVPLRHGERLLGVLQSGYRGRRDPFTAKQRQIAAGIARVAPLALETARLVRELETANNVKSHFTATLSHELRNLIAALRGYTFVLRSGRRLGEHDAKVVELAESCARELGDLVNATLDLSRFEARRVPLDVQEVHLAGLCEEMAHEVRPLAEAKHLRLECTIASDLEPLRTDALKLKMVLRNLLTNAIKFTERGTVSLQAQPKDGGVLLAVRDTGPGIPAESLQAVFEPFEQAHGVESRSKGGVGLGLYLVRRLTGVLGGTVFVESEVERGSTFHVWLPRDPGPPSARGPGHARATWNEQRPRSGPPGDRPGTASPA
jgi:signal transduction histidine kinase